MTVILSNSGGKPIYEQIVEQVKAQILTGTLQSGDLLPSMRTLARELRISVITTKRAYEELEREGFVESAQGRGTFVAAQNAQALREEQLRRAEEKLWEAIQIAKRAGISVRELADILIELDGGESE